MKRKCKFRGRDSYICLTYKIPLNSVYRYVFCFFLKRGFLWSIWSQKQVLSWQERITLLVMGKGPCLILIILREDPEVDRQTSRKGKRANNFSLLICFVRFTFPLPPISVPKFPRMVLSVFEDLNRYYCFGNLVWKRLAKPLQLWMTTATVLPPSGMHSPPPGF